MDTKFKTFDKFVWIIFFIVVINLNQNIQKLDSLVITMYKLTLFKSLVIILFFCLSPNIVNTKINIKFSISCVGRYSNFNTIIFLLVNIKYKFIIAYFPIVILIYLDLFFVLSNK